MTTDYQMSLLCYLVQFPDGVTYINDLEDNVFDLIEYKLSLQVLKKYYKQYKSVPGRVTAQQYLEEQIKDTPDLTRDMIRDLREVFEDMFVPIPTTDKQKLQDDLISEVQQKQLDSVYMDFAAGKIGNSQLFAKVDKIASLVKPTEDSMHEDGGFLIADRAKHYDEQVEGLPTYLEDLNAMTAARGFYSPQLVIFMSGPKHFKTGILINLVVEYARNGAKVYYADGENGASSIRTRHKMCIMGATREEVFSSDIREEMDELLYKFGHYMGGEIFIDSYPANTKSIGVDVRNRLTYLKETYGWEPDIIVYDSIDHFIPSKAEDQRRDVRLRIQIVYHEAINLNRQLHTFALAPSQVNRDALKKKTFDMTDLSEDFGKAMNAHAIFAICATQEEEEQGIRRIIPVAQREGVAYKGKNMCIVHIDEERMQVAEVNKEKYMESITDD